MSSTNDKLSQLVNIQPERHKNGALSIHPYFGKVDSALARKLIELFSTPEDLILDPFCGSGTVLHEATLLGRSSIGWDSSPLAILLSLAKLIGIESEERKELETIGQDLSRFGAKAGLFRKDVPNLGAVPPMPRVLNISDWFTQNALQELSFLVAYLESKKNNLLSGSNILAKVALSRIIIAASNQQGESTYRKVKKIDFPGKVIDLYIEALRLVANSSEKFSVLMRSEFSEQKRRLREHDNTWMIDRGESKSYICQLDTRYPGAIPRSMPQANLVVSSPPYLMSWDYGLYHKFRFYWLGLDLDSYEETEIGRHLRRKKDDVERYQSDMRGSFLSMSKVLSLDARIILINAPSIVYGKQVDTNKILCDCAKYAGWELEDKILSIGIPGPHHGMYASLESRSASAPGSRGKREHVLIFRRIPK